METGLAGKTVIVTGGGSNIARGVVLAFAPERVKVVIADIDEVQGQKVAKKATELGAQEALVVQTDVTKYDQVEAMIKKVLGSFEKIDVVVNVVGGGLGLRPFVEMPREQFEREIALNLWSVINCTQAVLPYMIEQRSGRIINFGSNAGKTGEPNTAVYSGTKGAVIAMSKAIAREVAQYGITVNAVCPWGTLPKDLVEDVGETSRWHPAKGFMSIPPDVAAEAVKSCPVGRFANPSDIGPAVVFLASDAAGYITGQAYSVDGGVTMI